MTEEQNPTLRNYVILYREPSGRVLSFQGIGQFTDYEREYGRICGSGNTILFDRPGLTNQQYNSIHEDVLHIHGMTFGPDVQIKVRSLADKLKLAEAPFSREFTDALCEGFRNLFGGNK